MKTLDLVQTHIEKLTEDKDLRQELWLSHLEGTPVSDLEALKLKKIKQEEIFQRKKITFQYILENPPTDFFRKILSNFTAREQEVMCMLAAGYEISEISEYNSISEVRLRQMIVNIRDSKLWEEIYGTKEKS